MKELLEKLDKEIEMQTRNGRTEVYIEVDDLNALGYGIDPKKKGRAWVDVIYLKLLINRYKFKDNLKVDVKPVKTFKELENEIKELERGKDGRN